MTHSTVDLKYFAELRSDAVQSTQIKVTYVGEQEKATPSVIILPAASVFDPAKFRPFHTANISYGNDQVVRPDLCELDGAAYGQVLTAVVRICESERTAPSRPFVSVTMIQVKDELKGRETILDRASTAQLLDSLQSHVPGQTSCASALRNFRVRIL